MPILDEKIRQRVLVKAQPGVGDLPMSIDRSEDIPGSPDGEKSNVAEIEHIDLVGSGIKRDTPIAWCATSDTPVALWNTFLCGGCHRLHALCYLAVAAEEQPPTTAGAANGPALRHGICQTCYRATRFSRRLAWVGRIVLALSRFVLGPFLPPRPPDNVQTPNMPPNSRGSIP